MKQHILKLMGKDPEQGMTLILEQYGNLLYAIAINILKNPQDAEDCISEILLGFWKNHRSIRSEEKLKSYLCTSTRNTAISMLRTRQKRMEQSLEDELKETFFIPDAINQRLSSEVIKDAIRSLGEPTGTILLRRYWCCESIDEIAAVLHLHPTAVQSRLYRGRKKLKEILIQGGIVHEDQ